MNIFGYQFTFLEIILLSIGLLISVLFFFRLRNIVLSTILTIKHIIYNVVMWFKPSLEGDDGKSSSRRITTFVVLQVYVHSRIKYNTIVTNPYWLLIGNIVDGLFILLLAGIVSFQQILELKTKLATKDSPLTTEINNLENKLNS